MNPESLVPIVQGIVDNTIQQANSFATSGDVATLTSALNSLESVKISILDHVNQIQSTISGDTSVANSSIYNKIDEVRTELINLNDITKVELQSGIANIQTLLSSDIAQTGAQLISAIEVAKAEAISYTDNVIANLPPVTISQVLGGINLLPIWNRINSNTVIVTENKRGGVFNYQPSGTINNITVFPAQDGGVWVRNHDNVINVEWADLNGNTYTSDVGGKSKTTKAIQACADLANAIALTSRVKLHFPASTGFAVNDTINIANIVDIEMDSHLVYTGPKDRACLDIGASNPTSRSYGRKLIGLRVKNGGTFTGSWDNEAHVGIRLRNLYMSHVEVIESSAFCIGVQCLATNGDGFVENTINLSEIVSCRWGLDLTQNTGGWVNDNLFINGHFKASKTDKEGQPRYGIRLSSQDGTYKNCNSNVFQKPSFELGEDEANYPGQITRCFVIEHGTSNTVNDMRSEGNSPILFSMHNDSTLNVFNCANVGTSSPTSLIEELGTMAGNIVINNSKQADKVHHPVMIVPDVTKMVFPYNATDVYFADALFAGSSSNANIVSNISGITINPDSITIPSNRCVGVRIQTKKVRRFIVQKFYLTGGQGRMRVRCYDVNGVLLNGTTTPTPLKNCHPSMKVSFNTSFGGAWYQGSDNGNALFFAVEPTVAYVDILFTGGTAPMQLQGFSIYSVDGTCPVQNIPKAEGMYSQVMPTATNYPIRTRVWNADLVTNPFMGWVWNGTAWKAFGQLI